MMTKSQRTDRADADRLFELLSHRRRRCILRALFRNEAPLSLTELVATVAAQEAADDAHLEDELVERVRLSLCHIHLPKLANEGVVRYDAKRETVSLYVRGERAERYRLFLEFE
jgi:hypothetical protein